MIAGAPLDVCDRCGRVHNHDEATALRLELANAEEQVASLRAELARSHARQAVLEGRCRRAGDVLAGREGGRT